MDGILMPVWPCHKPRAALLRAVSFATVLMLGACATRSPLPSQPPQPSAATPPAPSPEQTTLRNLITQQDRLYRVASPLLVSNADLCRGSARNLLGFTAKNKYSYSAELTEAASTLYGLDDRLQVMGVLAGSGAARVGVRPGDKMVAAEDKPMPQGANAERQAAILLTPMVVGRSSVKVTVLRDGANVPLTVPLTRACAYSIELGNADNVNAYNDGRRVLITRGMMNFARSDEELAYVLAREMAHNTLQHASKQNQSATIGDIIDNLIRIHPDMTAMAGAGGIRPMPPEMDTAADSLALYMVARAGYNADHATRFWERLASQYPASVPNAYTAIHPSTAARLAALEKTAAEIRTKQAARRPLLPPLMP
jgi:beta-barrel assembly-enhancing protease